jgi:hypothetical protein
MSLLPELIVQEMLIAGINKFREEEDLVGMLFRNLRQDDLELVRQFLRDKSVEICQNYPDQGLKVPAIVILMKAETEGEMFIGDRMEGPGDFKILGDMPFPKAELLGDQTTLGSGSMTPTGIAGRLLLEPTTATGGTTTTITVPEGVIKLVDPFEMEAYVVTMEGTGAGQRRQILSIEPTLNGLGAVITVSAVWQTIPDDTTIFKIVGAYAEEKLDGYTGEPAKLFESTDAIERLGEIQRATYQLDIHGSNQEEAIYLYNIIKAIIFIARRFLLRQGIQNVRIGGTDLAPLPEAYPNLVYRRSLSMTFDHSFDVFMELAQAVAQTIELAVSVHHPDVKDGAGVERTVSETEFDIS